MPTTLLAIRGGRSLRATECAQYAIVRADCSLQALCVPYVFSSSGCVAVGTWELSRCTLCCGSCALQLWDEAWWEHGWWLVYSTPQESWNHIHKIIKHVFYQITIHIAGYWCACRWTPRNPSHHWNNRRSTPLGEIYRSSDWFTFTEPQFHPRNLSGGKVPQLRQWFEVVP